MEESPRSLWKRTALPKVRVCKLPDRKEMVAAPLFLQFRLRAHDATTSKAVVCQAEESHRFADDLWRGQRVVIRDGCWRDARGDDDVNLGISQRMLRSLSRG